MYLHEEQTYPPYPNLYVHKSEADMWLTALCRDELYMLVVFLK